MAVYVDDARLAWRGKRWSHLTADTLEELHGFAARLGLRREWFQEGSRFETHHYDVTDSKREYAIFLGATPESTEEGAERRRASCQVRRRKTMADTRKVAAQIVAAFNDATDEPREDVCPACGGDGWYVGHEDECHDTGDCVCSGVQVECECQAADVSGRERTDA